MARHVKAHPPNRVFTPLEAQLLMMLFTVVVVIAGMILKQHHL
jgi:hypothetical protein